MTADPTAEWWTTTDVADYLGVTVSTVSAYRRRDQMIQPDRQIGRTWVWRPQRVMLWHARRPSARDAPTRYKVSEPEERHTPFTRDHGVTWDEPGARLDRRFEVKPAPTRVAELLELAPRTPVLARYFTFWAGDQPRQASRSYLPHAMVAGTPVEDPANEPWAGGTVAQMASLGVTVTRIEEWPNARMPTATETRSLRIAGGVPVLTITRRMLAGDRPVEAAADIVIPADRVSAHYVIDL